MKGGGLMPALLGMANAGTGGEQRLHGTLMGLRQSQGAVGPQEWDREKEWRVQAEN